MPEHIFIKTNNTIRNDDIVKKLMTGEYPDLVWIKEKRIGVFSPSQLDFFIEEEERHGKKILTAHISQPLKTMSSGERKKVLLEYLLHQNVEVLILVNPFDNLDVVSQDSLKTSLVELASSLSLIQVSNRTRDILPILNICYKINGDSTLLAANSADLADKKNEISSSFSLHIPPALQKPLTPPEILVQFKKVSVGFSEKLVLNKIDWTIRSNEFWQLIGPNGSGKSTLLQMITGDSHKGYGQDLVLFGQKKGSGESVWDIKKQIGYFSPAMVDRFRGYHTMTNMIISGLHDSVGLYYNPSEIEQNLAFKWLECLKLEHKKERYFNTLSLGEKRLILTARAMIKHPPLLILDEPTVGLDDDSTKLFVNLVNAYAQKSTSAIIYVSHRNEPQLKPQKTFELKPTALGSRGKKQA
ncbi:MAG: ATP-binding cassette domain-containing protein [Croceivirga sp.]